eukprot:471310_1
MATLFQHTSIDEWTFHELKAWIYTLNLKNSQKKKLKKVIVEQEITGADINSLNSVKDIIESFPEINAKSAKKLYNALLRIRKETKNDDTTAEDQELKQNKNEQNVKAFDDEKVSELSSFENQINQLLNIIRKHFKFMAKQEKTVNKMINGSGQQRNKLQNAKVKALLTEKTLLTEIMNITSMNDFLTNIILIENLFNYQYTKKEKTKQKNARNKYAKNISIYEKKSKPICN